MTDEGQYTRRERQIMDALHSIGEASAAEVRERLPDPPGYSTVRKLLEIMVEKGYVEYEKRGRKYVYSAVTPTGRAGRSALRRVLQTYFGGSPERAVEALLEESDLEVSDQTIREIEELIREASEEGR